MAKSLTSEEKRQIFLGKLRDKYEKNENGYADKIRERNRKWLDDPEKRKTKTKYLNDRYYRLKEEKRLKLLEEAKNTKEIAQRKAENASNLKNTVPLVFKKDSTMTKQQIADLIKKLSSC